MNAHDVRALVTIGVFLVIYQVVLGPIVLAIVRDQLRTRREVRYGAYENGKRGKHDAL